MELKISELKANPFKKYINEGKYDENRLEILKESIDHGTLPEHFFARKYNGVHQITSGHHRLKALSDVKGSEYPVDVTLVDFSDEQMLVDMVRENITQRDTDFHDTAESVVLARAWKQSGCTRVNQFNTWFKDGRKSNAVKGVEGFVSVPDSYRSIAKFLSKNGKAVSHVTVKHHLDIYDKLPRDIYEKVERKSHATDAHDAKDDDVIGITEAYAVANATSDETEQRALFDALRNSQEQYWNNQKAYLTTYKNAPEGIKEKVLSGELDIADIDEEVDKAELLEQAEKRPKTIFIPNFETRIRDFNKDVGKLERQVAIFSKIFHSRDFNERYAFLKDKQKESLNNLILNIKSRIEQCYATINFCAQKLEGNILEDKE